MSSHKVSAYCYIAQLCHMFRYYMSIFIVIFLWHLCRTVDYSIILFALNLLVRA